MKKIEKSHFTLIELLIVIGVIAILASLLLPALSRAKYMANLVACMNNQRQIAVSCTVYASENNDKWPNRPANSSGGWGRSSHSSIPVAWALMTIANY